MLSADMIIMTVVFPPNLLANILTNKTKNNKHNKLTLT